MKMLSKLTAAAFIAALCIGTTACNTPSSAASNTERPTVQDQKDVKLAKESLIVPKTIARNVNKINLLTTAHGSTITWWSSNPVLIDTNGNVTHKDGNDFDTVTLSATIKKGKASDTRSFTVKVAQKNRSLSDEEACNTLPLSFEYDKNKYKDQEISVKTSAEVDGKTVNLTYTSNDEKHLKYDAGTSKVIVHRDIVDVTGVLTVTLTCGEKSIQKSISVVVERIPEFKYTNNGTTNKETICFSFDGTTLTKTSTMHAEDKNAKFSYKVNAQDSTITLSKTHIYINDTFYTKEEAIASDIKKNMAMPEALKTAYTDPTLKNFKEYMNLTHEVRSNPFKDEEALIQYIINKEEIYNCFQELQGKTNLTSEDFNKLTQDQKAAGIKNYCTQVITSDADYYNVSDTSSFDAMFEAIKDALKKEIEIKVSKKFFANQKFTYTVAQESDSAYQNGVWFNPQFVYDTDKKWYEQSGEWKNGVTSNPVSIGYEQGSWMLEVGDINYYGNFDSSYTTFTYHKIKTAGVKKAEIGAWTFEAPVVDSATQEVTMKVTNQQDAGKTGSMKFTRDQNLI
ncbi:MAG: immunoglobulin-like domain-containing protein [Treponema sp.]